MPWEALREGRPEGTGSRAGREAEADKELERSTGRARRVDGPFWIGFLFSVPARCTRSSGEGESNANGLTRCCPPARTLPDGSTAPNAGSDGCVACHCSRQQTGQAGHTRTAEGTAVRTLRALKRDACVAGVAVDGRDTGRGPGAPTGP